MENAIALYLKVKTAAAIVLISVLVLYLIIGAVVILKDYFDRR